MRDKHTRPWLGWFGWLLIALALAGCPHDVTSRMPGGYPGEPSGSLEFRFTRAAQDITIAVNGQIVVDGAHSQRVTVHGVPVGQAQVAIAAGAGEKQLAVWVDANHTVHIPVPSTSEPPAAGLRGFVLSLVSITLYALLR